MLSERHYRLITCGASLSPWRRLPLDSLTAFARSGSLMAAPKIGSSDPLRFQSMHSSSLINPMKAHRRFNLIVVLCVLSSILFSCGSTDQVGRSEVRAIHGRSLKGRGAIRGLVVNQETGEPLLGATIRIKGTSFSTIAHIDGTYEISGIPHGDYTIRTSLVAFRTVEHEHLKVQKDSLIILDFHLVKSFVTID